MTRSAPKAVRTTSANGANAAGPAPGAASVTRPDSLQTVLGLAARSVMAAAHGSTAPPAMPGLPQ